MAETTKKNTAKNRPMHSGFEAPAIGVKANGPAKYLPNGNINPAWKKAQGAKK